MFDNICTLPLTADIFTQAIHPTLPILSVGLSSGHIQTYRLPSELAPTPTLTTPPTANNTTKPQPSTPSLSSTNGTTSAPPSALTPPHTSRRTSGAGFDIIETLWRTRRHKGSCRSLVYSLDGYTLFSAGSDGVLKAADTHTGRVHSKIIAPVDPHTKLPEVPSVICVLSPKALLLGTDVGGVHVYDLSPSRLPSTPTLTANSNSKSQPTMPGPHLRSLSAHPSASYRPHVTPEEPHFSESITSLTALPPSAASSSGTSRAWVSTAGGCVAVTDLRRAVLSCSADQGDVLLSSVCVGGVGGGGVGGSGNGKRKVGMLNGNGATAGEEKVLVGGANVSMTVWERGDMRDRKGTVVVQRDGGGLKDESTIDCIAAVPHSRRIAVGLGDGKIVFVLLKGRGGEIVDSVGHDEMNAEGVTTLGFDLEGRMISGGGTTVKIWQPQGSRGLSLTNRDSVEDEDVGEDIVQMGDGSNEDDDGSDSDSEAASKKHKKKKRRKNIKVIGKFGEHGVMAFSDLQ